MLLSPGREQAVYDDAVKGYKLDRLQFDNTGQLLSRFTPTDFPAVSQAGKSTVY